MTQFQGNGKFLNDLWRFYFSGGSDGCYWHQINRPQTLKEQFLSRDSYPTTPNRRGSDKFYMHNDLRAPNEFEQVLCPACPLPGTAMLLCLPM